MSKLIRIHLQSTFFTYVPKTFACFSFKFILACCTQLIDLSSPRIVTHYFAKKPLKKYFRGPGGVPRHMHGDFEILGSEHLGGSNDQAELDQFFQRRLRLVVQGLNGTNSLPDMLQKSLKISVIFKKSEKILKSRFQNSMLCCDVLIKQVIYLLVGGITIL